MSFQLTDAGRAAIADSANRRINQVVFTHMAIGDGVAMAGVDDGGRLALRNERQRQGLTAVTGGSARLGVRASFSGNAGDAVWNATEVGLIAQVGADPAFLAAYGAVEATAGPYAAVAPEVSATIAATVDVVASDADVAVMVAPDLTVAGASTFAALLDTPDALVPLAYYRANAGADALVSMSAAQVLSDLLSGLAAGSYLRVRAAAGVRSLVGLSAAQLAAVFLRRWHLANDFSFNSAEWTNIGSLDVPVGWRCSGAVTVGGPSAGFRVTDGGASVTSGQSIDNDRSFRVSFDVATGPVAVEVRRFGAPGGGRVARGGEHLTFLVATAR